MITLFTDRQSWEMVGDNMEGDMRREKESNPEPSKLGAIEETRTNNKAISR